jgi:hypothetical protein
MSEMNEISTIAEDTNQEVLEGVVEGTWSRRLGTAAEPRDAPPAADLAPGAEDQLEARVRISGDSEWEVTLRGSWRSAEEAANRMLASTDAPSAQDRDGVVDAWGELVNTLASNLKACLELSAHRLSIPVVSKDTSATSRVSDEVEYAFSWDGHAAIVRLARVTPA